MLSKAAVRRRKRQGPNPTPSTEPDSAAQAADEESSASASPSRLQRVLPYLVIPGKVLGGLLFGGLCAASFQSDRAGVVLFVATVVLIFALLFVVFYSMLGANDQTLIPLPTVYKPSGEVIRQDAITVLEHDRRIAHYYAAELPMLAAAAAWFHLWTGIRGAFPVLAMYVAFRVNSHPLFRVHVFGDPDDAPETQRPFGIAPLFTPDDKSRVQIVAGRRHFSQILAETPPSKLIVVDVSAPWCAPCQAMAPVFRKLADEFPQCAFLTIDVDVSQDLAADLEITSVPSFLFYQAGQRMELVRGGTEDKIRKAIQSHLS